MDRKYKLYISIIVIILISMLAVLITHNNIVEKDNYINIRENYVEGRPTLVVGDDINYPPYSFLDEDGNPAGFNIDLIRALGNILGYNIEIKLDTWSNTMKDLEAGEIDLVTGMFKSDKRSKTFSFSIRTAVTSGEIFSTKRNSVDSIEDLKNQQVVVLKDDIIHEFLEKENNDKNLNIEIIEVDTIKEGLELLEDGQYQYAALLEIPGSYVKNDIDMSKIHPQNIEFSFNDYSIAALKGREELINMINGGLSLMKTSGNYDEIYDKWLGVYEKYSYREFIRDNFLIIIGFLSIILLLFIIIIIMRFIIKSKTKKLDQSNIELKISEEKNRAIIKAIPDLIFIINKDGIIEDALEEDDNLLISKNSFKGLNIKDILSEDLHEKVKDIINKAVEDGGVKILKYKTILEDKKIHTYHEIEGFRKGKEEVFEMRVVKLREDQILAISRDITTDELNQNKIQYLSFHDQLTGLYNRRFFEEELKRLDTERMLPLSVVMTDVNGLKLINDSFGHDSGDQLLIEFSKILKNSSREEDIICRIGGDEFVILLPNMNHYYLPELVNRIKDKLENKDFKKYGISAAFGFGTKDEKGKDVNDIIKEAEDMMYRNKFIESPHMKNKTIDTILNILHESDEWEKNHSQRVSEYCEMMGQELNFSEKDIKEVKMSGLLHDIGKITLKDTFIDKKGSLNKKGKSELRRHSEVGYRILSTYKNLYNIADYILYHHENWDGTGYPKGLKGEDIPLKSRIIAIANHYDTATRNRPNKNNLTKEEACRDLLERAATCFDPKLVEIFTNKILNR
jgi:diguanylate cyclase (GGDEF)-like protein/putative nucleotidyltransferase with HDIG domain